MEMKQKKDNHFKNKLVLIVALLAAVSFNTAADAQTFTKLTLPTTSDNSAGCGWIDYNNDGRLDAYLTWFNRSPVLYSNNGDGSFQTITQGQLIPSGNNFSGICWGDYNNDGLSDLFVTSMSGGNVLFKNLGDGKFERVTGSGISASGSFLSANWIDYDNDGNLDLFITASGTSFSSVTNNLNYLFRNNGDGTFIRVTDNALAAQQASSSCAAFGDFDNDGKMDVFLTEWGKDNLLFKNNGDETFTQITGMEVNSNRSTSITASWGDYDNDGYLDLFVGNGSTSQTTKQNSYLFHNDGDGTFTEIKSGEVAEYSGCVWTSAWGDVNNDGYLDLYVGTIYEREPLLFINNGDGTFALAHEFGIDSSSSGTGITGASFGDYDDDGYLDLLVADAGGAGRTMIYHNNGGQSHWLTVACEGVISNQSAIGARVKVKATIGGKTFWQIREITGVQGFRGTDDLRAHFGLGDASVIDSLVVEWPSGLKTVETHLSADRVLKIVEQVPTGYLKAFFSTDASSGYSPLPVHFKDISKCDTTNPVVSWSWDLNGDGIAESNERDPSFTYNIYEGKNYDVSLTVSNGKTTQTCTRKGCICIFPSSTKNLALNMNVTASSEGRSIFAARRAADGSTLTWWTSASSDTQWIQVELDTTCTVGKVILRWGGSYAKKYEILHSQDGNSWVVAASVDNGDGQVDEIEVSPFKAKYVRVYATESSNKNGYSVAEFEIYRPVVNAISDKVPVPSEFNLDQNYPNPFNPSTIISYRLSGSGHVSLRIYDALGREVAVLVNGRQSPGSHRVTFDASKFPSGVYFYRLSTDESTDAKKMVLLR